MRSSASETKNHLYHLKNDRQGSLDHLSGKDYQHEKEYCVTLHYWDPKQRQCRRPLPVHSSAIRLMLGKEKLGYLLKWIHIHLQEVCSTK